MAAKPGVVVKLFDRIAHHATTELDREQTLGMLRRVLNGKMPSDVVLTDAPKPHRSYDAWQEKIADLERKITEVETAKTLSERQREQQIKQFTKIIEQLRQRAESRRDDDMAPAADGSYTRVQVNSIILTIFGKDHGVKKALVEKNYEARQQDTDLPKITDSLLQKWRRADSYPAWMVAQLKALTPEDVLGRKSWTAEEKRFLHELYLDNPRLSNLQLAKLCSARFGRRITDSGIRGMLSRARVANLITYRPKGPVHEDAQL